MKQAKKNMALFKKVYMPIDHLQKEDTTNIGFFNCEFRSSFSRKHT